MATKLKKSVRNDTLIIKKLKAGVALGAFIIMLASGLLAGVSVETITYRAFWVILAVLLVSRVIIAVLGNYEEMNNRGEG